FDGNDYSYWKTRMTIFISLDYKLWNIITNGLEILTKIVNSPKVIKLDNEYNEHDYKLFQLNAKTKHVILCALSPSEFNRVSSLDSAKELWDRLMITYEGTNQKQVICYECDKPGHIRPDCPRLKKRKDNLKKKAMIATWSDSDDSSSDDGEENEEVTNIAFTAIEDYNEVRNSCLSFSEIKCEYDDLIDVLNDLNKEY
ncbi:LOW QUALITY PROTEIN: zf-CCHC domain-containing protein/DUF4219 domain-containing protein, partial [Cephalotus follicularis]